MDVLSSPWLITSIALTGAAALILGLLILPSQQAVLATLAGVGAGAGGGTDTDTEQLTVDRAATARLAMLTGTFNLLWATVTILMIVRPGSTTGA
jgi:hypothetical protein